MMTNDEIDTLIRDAIAQIKAAGGKAEVIVAPVMWDREDVSFDGLPIERFPLILPDTIYITSRERMEEWREREMEWSMQDGTSL